MMMFEVLALVNGDKYQLTTSVDESINTHMIKEEGKVFSFDLDKLLGNGKHTKVIPLINNSVSLETGVFGLTYGKTVSDMTALLGVPSSKYVIDDGHTLYSYGRNLWVLTKNNRVTRIQNDNEWVLKRISNYMAFDERLTNSWVK
ncbi:hypothetical protein [Alteromonas gracilis]|uniref:hypothetical protein n=1 Tax=Alteromonas gracilis TaxID=1479524 RepID=UPI0030D2F68B